MGLRALRLTVVLALCSATLPAARASADDAPPPLVVVSLLDTLLLPGEYDVSIAETSLQAGRAAGLTLSVDALALAPIELGVQALVLQRDSDDPGLAHSTVSHVGAHVGATFTPSDHVLLGAAALFGLQTIDFADAETLTTGLGLGLLGHASVRVSHWLWLRGQVGLLLQPAGGHEASDLTMPPTPFVGLGMALGVPGPSR